jgi:hypothetical protein
MITDQVARVQATLCSVAWKTMLKCETWADPLTERAV